jgi:ribosomal protein L32
MAVPKRKTTPSRKGMRQARHAKANSGQTTIDKESGLLRLRHHAHADATGAITYRGKLIKAAKLKPEAEAESATE